MNERQNAGYVITDAIHVGDTEIVIGEHPKAAAPYVTWLCIKGDNYFWGHYFMDRKDAMQDLVQRVKNELNFEQQKDKNRSNDRKRGEER